MIGSIEVILSVAVLVVAAMFEIFVVRRERRDLAIARVMCSLGFMAYAFRLIYLLYMDDLLRLHYAAMLPIVLVGVGRIYATVCLLRKWPDKAWE